jgi:hypothetical protein
MIIKIICCRNNPRNCLRNSPRNGIVETTNGRFPAAVPERFNTAFLIIDEKMKRRPHSFFITGTACIYAKYIFT